MPIPEFKCPNCSCMQYTRARSSNFVAFTNDYVCMECKEQIPAPVPLWGSIAFMVLGFPFACLGAFWIFANALSFNITGLAVGAGILIVGVVSFWYGLTSLRG